MHDLRLVGVHEDGEHLLLSGPDGARFALPVDDALRAAVRRDRAHLGQLQIEIDGGLRPRDVQARIRAGQSADDVAAVAGWTVEKVQRYEGPVLAEREHVAAQARGVRVRRHSADPLPLGDLVTQRLTARGVDTDRIVWDAWRPDRGPWVVVVVFAAGGRERQARWSYDPAARAVTAADDEARWLSEDESTQGPVPTGRLSVAAGAADAERLGSAASAVYDIEADGGVTAEPRRDVEGGPLDLMTAMRSRRRGRDTPPTRRHPGRPAASPVASTGDQPSDVPGSAHPAGRRRPRPEPLELDPTLMDDPPAAHPRPEVSADRVGDDAAVDPELPLGTTPAAGPAEPVEAPVEAPVDDTADPTTGTTGDEPADEPAALPAAAPAAPARTATSASRRGRRSSIPSWDDIVFGTKSD